MIEPISLLVGAIALQVVGFLLAPRPAQPNPPNAEDIQTPTAEAGRPIPVVFGDVRVTGLNVLWYGDLQTRTRQVRV